MAITIRGNTKISSKVSVGSYVPPSPTPTPTITPTPTQTPIPPSSTFNFTFNQQWASANATVSSIGGFTSTPSFTPTSNAFTFNSTGSPTGSTTFSFTMTSGGISATIDADLIQNGSTVETINNTITLGYTFVFTPITVSQNDTIQISTYIPD